jgi:hypothetical protein
LIADSVNKGRIVLWKSQLCGSVTEQLLGDGQQDDWLLILIGKRLQVHQRADSKVPDWFTERN